MSELRFAGQTVVVTGAGTGIGRVTAVGYAREGAHVVLAGRRVELLDETAAAIRAFDGACTLVAADVGREDACLRIVERALAVTGRLDVLVNNAGAPGADMTVAEMSLDNWN